jgi:hypothetical protein
MYSAVTDQQSLQAADGFSVFMLGALGSGLAYLL